MNTKENKEEYIASLVQLYGMKDGQKVSSRVIITRELFFNEATGFGSFLAALEKMEEIITISGVFMDRPECHRTYLISGEKGSYKERPQIKASQCEITVPETKYSNFRFIMSLNRLGRYSSYLLETYGDQAICQLLKLNYQEVLDEVTKANFTRIDSGFASALKEEMRSVKDIFTKSATLNQLLSLDLSKNAARKLYNLFGPRCFETIKENPYVILKYYEDLGYDIHFCDKIAMKFGYKSNHPNRLEYGVIHGLNIASQDGHVYIPKDEFIELLEAELSVYIPDEKIRELSQKNEDDFDFEYFNEIYRIDCQELKQLVKDRSNFVNDAHERKVILYQPSLDDVENALNSAIRKNLVVNVDDRIYERNIYERELELASAIHTLGPVSSKPSARHIHPESVRAELKELNLEAMQEKACIEFLKDSGGVFVLVGPAGSGKTYTIKALIDSFMKIYHEPVYNILLLAPTGRAAKRIQESTSYEASTIHRALGMDPLRGWTFNKSNKLTKKLIIVDEFSMVDTEIAYRLFDAIDEDTKVILVGDTKQLASVGPGNVLKDIIESKVVPVIELDVIKRQQDNSDIINNSIRVIQKEKLVETGKNKDAFVLFKSYNDQMQQAAMASIKRIQTTMQLDAEQIQVLIPQRKSRIGTYYFNHIIQNELNKNENSPVIANQFNLYNSDTKRYDELVTYFRVGDKVINIKNNYQAKWFDKTPNGDYVLDNDLTIVTNGEIGIIEEIIKGKKSRGDRFGYRIIVRVDTKYLYYDDDFDNLELAYAITVHKSQGSQWKAVIYMISNSHKKMLTNNLMYTAMTRPSNFLVVIGDEKAIDYGIQNDIIAKRYSTLRDYLEN